MTTPAWENKSEHTLLPPLLTAAATTARTASLDMYEADYVELRIMLSAENNTSNAGTVISIADNTSASTTGATTVVADQTVVNNVGASLHLKELDWKADRERYLILTVTPGTTVANDVISVAADATKCRLKTGPSSTTGKIGDTTYDTVVIG